MKNFELEKYFAPFFSLPRMCIRPRSVIPMARTWAWKGRKKSPSPSPSKRETVGVECTRIPCLVLFSLSSMNGLCLSEREPVGMWSELSCRSGENVLKARQTVEICMKADLVCLFVVCRLEWHISRVKEKGKKIWNMTWCDVSRCLNLLYVKKGINLESCQCEIDVIIYCYCSNFLHWWLWCVFNAGNAIISLSMVATRLTWLKKSLMMLMKVGTQRVIPFSFQFPAIFGFEYMYV